MERQAIDLALEMVSRPFLIRQVQRSPLPEGVREAMRLVTCNETELAEAGTARGRDPKTLHQAAVFFLQQALLFPGADSHRILGLSHGATLEQIRDHRRLMLKWLHPDRNPSSWEQMLFQRVITAAADLEQRLANPSATADTIGSLPQRQRSRSHVRHLPLVRRTPPLQWRLRLRTYLRRAAVTAILLTLGGGAWRIFYGEPIGLTLTEMGLLPW